MSPKIKARGWLISLSQFFFLHIYLDKIHETFLNHQNHQNSNNLHCFFRLSLAPLAGVYWGFTGGVRPGRAKSQLDGGTDGGRYRPVLRLLRYTVAHVLKSINRRWSQIALTIQIVFASTDKYVHARVNFVSKLLGLFGVIALFDHPEKGFRDWI